MTADVKKLEEARKFMLTQQLKPWGVNNQRVLEQMEKIHRHEFFPPEMAELSYSDTELPIGHSQFCLAPKIIGRILQAINVYERDNILELGTGSAYLTTLLASLGFHVTSVDIIKEFTDKAKSILSARRLSNFHIINGDLFNYIEDKRDAFNVVIITGSIPNILPEMLDLLSPGGRLFCVIGQDNVMHANLWEKNQNGEVQKSSLFETVIPPLKNYPVKQEFSF